MYIRRIKGPHSVTLPDGSVLSRADLPEPDTRRWVARRKATVVQAVDHGLLSAEEACGIWSLSEEELDAWRRAAARHGVAALKATAVQRYRDPRAD
ncbi:CtrA inhibitor SciP [Roseicyclus sp.]|uniref:CtrA inhibitor SciP n=1 Tax=Roseicyclus sp. TaxID=1914329 RepID=UPI003FA0BA67